MQSTTSSSKGTSQVPSTSTPTEQTTTVASSNPTAERVEETAPVQSTEEVALSNPTEPSTTVVAKEETTTVQQTESATTTKEPVTEQSTTQAPKVEENTTAAQTEAPTVAPTEAPTQTEPIQPTTEEVTTAEVATSTPHSHSYTSTVTKTATCTEEGITTFTCSCGDGYTEPIAKVAHSFGEYIYNNDATTENDGTKTATCSVCGATDTVTAEGTKITEHEHDYQKTDKGWDGWHCTICGELIPLPTEHCPYPVNTIIDRGDGTYCMYYVDSNDTRLKYGIDDGAAGSNAHNDFMTFCDKNYLESGADGYIGDYAEGCINLIEGYPKSF